MLVLSTGFANAGDFTVSIVGQSQSNQGQYKEEGLPIVFCPEINSKRPDGAYGKSSGNCFFVIIQNTHEETNKVSMSASAWYDCLKFKITDSSGKDYTVTRTLIDWSANPTETWTFQGEGMRVLAVDFTGDAMFNPMGGWQGLPPPPLSPEIVSMAATFRYYHSEVTSTPAKVYLCGLPK